MTEIAHEFGLSVCWTGRALVAAGAELPQRRNGVKRTDLDVDTIVEQYASGASVRALAARHDTCYGTVRRLLQRAGVQLRPHGGRH
ncbi:hypothetical protein GCM10022222_51940 [Amycolatopsis ultiminotia]|uniref:Helix-turn-helix domain-containing protein n=1 Tax=Amycolatopsis ultiminotia TaxID=543629 RepID=A0ABP6X7W3_9PSEU